MSPSRRVGFSWLATKGMPPISIRSGVEKKAMASGYRSMVETMLRRSSSTQGIPASFAAMPTASPQGPAPMTARYADSVAGMAPGPRLRPDLDDLIPPRPDAHVPHRRPRQLLQPV